MDPNKTKKANQAIAQLRQKFRKIFINFHSKRKKLNEEVPSLNFQARGELESLKSSLGEL